MSTVLDLIVMHLPCLALVKEAVLNFFDMWICLAIIASISNSLSVYYMVYVHFSIGNRHGRLTNTGSVSSRKQSLGGFQIGYVLIFDSSSHDLMAKAWLQQYTPIISITHIPSLRRVFITLSTGSMFAYSDEVEYGDDPGKLTAQLSLIAEYHDLGQPASCVVAVPQFHGEGGGGVSHELWVGQAGGMITVLDPSDLTVLKFIRNTSDKSLTPSYMAHPHIH